jgi:hypothetical protein
MDHFEEFVADAVGNQSIAVQFRGSQQGFQYGLLLAHNFLLSKKGAGLFCSVGTRRQNLALQIRRLLRAFSAARMNRNRRAFRSLTTGST